VGREDGDRGGGGGGGGEERGERQPDTDADTDTGIDFERQTDRQTQTQTRTRTRTHLPSLSSGITHPTHPPRREMGNRPKEEPFILGRFFREPLRPWMHRLPQI
jgi:hypothetical protein